MYESELNWQTEDIDQIPPIVRKAFAERKASVKARSVLSWSEHCTECAAPECYRSCGLYEARPRDSMCRRFVQGMVRIDHSDGLLPYVLKIQFKRWGKLWSEGNTRLYPLTEANLIERRDQRIGAVLRTLPLHLLPMPHKYRKKLVRKRFNDKMKFAARPNVDSRLPDLFLIECYNPQSKPIHATFTVRSKQENALDRPPFQRLVRIPPGFHREEIPVGQIASLVDLRNRFIAEIVPNEIEDGTILYFGITEFVELAAATIENTSGAARDQVKKCKCIVWDLDNTLWSGVLIEDGLQGITLKPGIVELIRELDRRGILHSVASKNNEGEALDALKHFGLDDYFLCPQISWGPKSVAVQRIVERLNISAGTVLFVDDQLFEREEVQASLPEVLVLDAARFQSLRERDDCQGSQTRDAVLRRVMYQEQLRREQIQQTFGIDKYRDFLKACQIVLDVRAIMAQDVERVHELAQRTNQLNFSGNRYNRQQIEEIVADPNLDTFVLTCRDKFGAYGTVGFCVIDKREPRMIDLAFSCRIQNKRVEHVFLAHLIRTYAKECGSDFLANYRKTERNAPQGRVFHDLGFEELTENDGLTTLVHRRQAPIVDEQIVKIITSAEGGAAS